MNIPSAGGGPPEASSAEDASVSLHYDRGHRNFSWAKRLEIQLIAAAVYAVIRVIGPTLRYEVLGWQHAERIYDSGGKCIWTFFHRVIIPVAWWGRDRGVTILISTAADGLWARKVVEWLGFGSAPGSSSRGGLRGLAIMAQRMKEGHDTGFTVDGPRGPRFVAKPGPVMLARQTGFPVLTFHIAVDRGKTFHKAWDYFLLPLPFAHAVMLFAPPIWVPQDADEQTMAAKREEMQKELDRIREIGDRWFAMSEQERDHLRLQFNA